MWGTDLTATFTGEGQASVFIVVDHFTAECVGIYASSRTTRFEALEPIRRAGARWFAQGHRPWSHRAPRHGSQYMSDHFICRTTFRKRGIALHRECAAFARASEGNGLCRAFSSER
jgi:putative transposase